MTEADRIRAVLYARSLQKMVAFYSAVLGSECVHSDEHHAVFDLNGLALVIHQIPPGLASGIDIAEPPVRRESGAIRLDYPVADIGDSRTRARALGGDIDARPPPWAEPGAGFFLGNDPEGNVFGVGERNRAS